MIHLSYSLKQGVLPFLPNNCFKAVIPDTVENNKIIDDMLKSALNNDFYEFVDSWVI